jgi:hypothetical protein
LAGFQDGKRRKQHNQAGFRGDDTGCAKTKNRTGKSKLSIYNTQIISWFVHPFDHYWTEDFNKKRDNAYLYAKLFYCGIIIYFLSLSSIASFRQHTVYPLLITLPISLFLLFILVCDLLYYHNITNKVTIWSHVTFIKIISRILIGFEENKKKSLPAKTVIQRLIYITVFFFIPLAFIYLLFYGHWQSIVTSGFSGGTIGSLQGIHEDHREGFIKIKPMLNRDIVESASYFFGDVLNKPILSICFSNNGTKSEAITVNQTFRSEVLLENVSLTIPYHGRICSEISRDRESVNFTWDTSYGYIIPNESVRELSAMNEPLNQMDVEINKNIFFVGLAIILAWIAICHLFYSVFKDLDNLK